VRLVQLAAISGSAISVPVRLVQSAAISGSVRLVQLAATSGSAISAIGAKSCSKCY
jgi:hypothetical protein